MVLSRREPFRGSTRAALRIARGVATVIGISLFIALGMECTGDITPYKIHLTPKQYARIQLTQKDYVCLSILYGKESAWNPRASNGSHYGIPQGRSIYLKTATAQEQIDWGLKYIGHRYGYNKRMQPNACNALKHWRLKGWH